ncbi:N-formylglutamate amidohydrolase [Alteraurantiacibacter aquimixticola]|uniref:N-formylglutamate amidohydrolase n=2 Tax=Alteraurantiacibacter aquimixticola TaxID=2489173 RepID=A0A4T3F5J1_9SPHN|nr:N-formylglutamate amidohydrolase [Alteraurantiacibacter aquimixticola]
MPKIPRDSGPVQGGLLPGAEGQAAFELHRRKPSAVPVLLAVPHAGRAYPPDLLQRMRHPEQACLRLEDRLADLVATRVAEATGAALLVANAPRAMIDLNRATEDMDWEMVAGGRPGSALREALGGRARYAAGRRARSGLGLVPRRLPGMGELWKSRLDPEELDARIELVHRPYHGMLAQALETLRDRWGAALLLDIHSMPPLGSKAGHDPAPDFVIGDRYGSSCGAHLSLAAFHHFDAEGRRAAHNRPYAGGYVLDRHGAPARGLHAMQVEICRAAYLDPSLQEAGEGLDAVADVIAGLVRRLAEELVAGPRSMPQAAE